MRKLVERLEGILNKIGQGAYDDARGCLYDISQEIGEAQDAELLALYLTTADRLFRKMYATDGRNAVDILLHAHAVVDKWPFLQANTNSSLRKLHDCHCGLLQNICVAYAETGDMASSRQYGEEAVRYAGRYFGEDSPQLANALMRLSILPYRQRDYGLARRMLARAMGVFAGHGDKYSREVGTCLNNLGRICEESGDIVQGIDWHKKAVALRRSLDNPEDLAFSLGNLGTALAQAGQLREAIHYLEKSLQCYAENNMGDSREAASFRANLGNCYAIIQEDGV